MASQSPSPDSPPSAVPPVSIATSPPPSSSSSTNSSATSPPPSNPSTPSPPLAQSPPPPLPTAPPPATTPSPPAPTPRSLPPPPPSQPSAPPPAENSPPPPVSSPPPPPLESPPPKSSAAPPVSPSPPPPVTIQPPTSSKSPPSPAAKSPERSPPPPRGAPPPPSSSGTAAPPSPPSPPPSDPSSSSSPPSPSPPNTTTPTTNSSSVAKTPTISPLPSIPNEKPTAEPTTPTPNITANATSHSNGGTSTGAGVGIGIVVGFLVLSLAITAVWFVRKRKRRGAGSNGVYTMPSPFASSQNSDSSFLKRHPSAPPGSNSGSNFMYSSSDQGGVGNSKSWFTYEELLEVTDGFSSDNLLGEGGFGCVYKGCLSDGREVAVKQLKIGGGQGEREFRAEVEIISRVHHRHLVSLVGYCISEHHRLLVYDYVPNNTLYYHLHGEDRPVMDWETRVRVAAGAARGLAYLHEDCHPRIIHRDIKSSNILLDNNFEALVSDFGLAKLALDANTHVTTRVMGTFGYMAPEYASTGKLTEKSDVFSFGVVLLELITGRKPVDVSQPLGDESLVEWARPLLAQALDNRDFEGLVDPRLKKNFIETEVFRMVEAAAACVRHSASKRPRMGQVMRALDSIGEFADLTNGMKPGQSEVYDSAQQSAEIRMFQRLAFGNQDYSSGFFNRSHDSNSRSWNDV